MLLIGMVLSLLVGGGCAATQQMREDVQQGVRAPMNLEGETPAEVAARTAAPLAQIPYGSVAVPVVTGFLTFLYAWHNGRRIRQHQPVTTRPYVGQLGRVLPIIEQGIQLLATVVPGLLNPPGNTTPGWSRMYKGVISVGVVGLTAYLSSPAFHTFLQTHPQVIAGIAAGLPLLLALEKKMQEVLPTVPKPDPVPHG